MNDVEFEQLVVEGIQSIPEHLRKKVQNVEVVIVKHANRSQQKKFHLGHEWALFGLYEGIPLTERGEAYGGLVLPDKITIFKQPILDEASGNNEKIREIVRDTVWHEIAHYFGYNDAEIEIREENSQNHSS